MYSFSFERLHVWQEARRLAVSVYRLTALFPSEEKFGMVSQLRRAVLSVASNIAEGTARVSKKEQANFYQIAYSSLAEVLNQLIISVDLGFFSQNDLSNYRNEINALSLGINKLRASALSASGKQEHVDTASVVLSGKHPE